MKRSVKIAAICTSVALAAAAVGGGIWAFLNRSGGGDAVYVYPFYMVGMTEFWGDNHESYGPVTTDRIQTVYLSETQEVTKIAVTEGQEVKKGDLLISFDTTLSELQLERKRLEAEKAKLDLEEEEQTLIEIKNMRPMSVTPAKQENTKEDKGSKLKDPYKISKNKTYDGSSKELSMICWLNSSTAIDDSLFETIRKKAEDYQNDNAVLEAKEKAKKKKKKYKAPDHITVSGYYCIFKVTKSNMSRGSVRTWQGMHVKKTSKGFKFSFFDASGMVDYTLKQKEVVEMPEIDFGSGYTAAELAKMRQEQEGKIKDAKIAVKLAEAEYKIMLSEVNDGNVYAEIDGTVVSVKDAKTAKNENMPVVKVSGGGGFFVEGALNELDRESMSIGDSVTVMDWSAGASYPGEVVYIGDLPRSEQYYDGMSNPNASYYSFRVFVDESANLQAGSYANIQYSAGSSAGGIYLENPYLRTEGGRSFVYVVGEDGRLEERTVTTGRNLWGSYTEITAGLTASDSVAFPYGKGVKPGAKTQVGDYSTLYG